MIILGHKNNGAIRDGHNFFNTNHGFANADGSTLNYTPMTPQQKNAAAFYLQKIEPFLIYLTQPDSGIPISINGFYPSALKSSMDTFQISWTDFMVVYNLCVSLSSGSVPNDTIASQFNALITKYGWNATTTTTTTTQSPANVPIPAALSLMTPQQTASAAYFLKKIDPVLTNMLNGSPFMLDGNSITLNPNEADFKVITDMKNAVDTFNITFTDFMVVYQWCMSIGSGYSPNDIISNELKALPLKYAWGKGNVAPTSTSSAPTPSTQTGRMSKLGVGVF